MNKLLKLSFRLMKLNKSSKLIYLLLLPPFYGMWLFGISNIVSNKKAKLYISLATLLLTLLLSIIFVLYPILLLTHSPILQTTFYVVFINLIAIYWYVVVLFVSIQSIKYENKLNTSNGKSQRTIVDYFVRYFILINWWLGIWAYQPIVNKYKTIGIVKK